VAILVEVMTDNRNRTVNEIVRIFERHGGNMGQPGCVNWMFSHKGIITVAGHDNEEALMDVALGAGAEDMTEGGEGFEIICPPEAYETVKKALADAAIPVATAELTQRPQTFVSLDENHARKVLALLEALDDHDDVQKVYSNFDVAPEVMEKLQSA
jgi:YebC/PmpR family DNA-binding regulatory protein